MLDRIDIHLEVPRVFEACDKLADDRAGESSAAIRERVETARERQRQRLQGTALTCNADMGPAEIKSFCQLDGAGKQLMRSAMQQLGITARGFHRTRSVKLGRTIADPSASLRTGLTGADAIHPAHPTQVGESQHRRPGRRRWIPSADPRAVQACRPEPHPRPVTSCRTGCDNSKQVVPGRGSPCRPKWSSC